MGWISRVCFWLGVLTGLTQLQGAGTGFRFTVRIYDYAAVSEVTLAKAEREASRIFLQAGVKLLWVECTASEKEIEKFRACEQATETFGMSMSILSPSMAARLARSARVSGMAVPDQAFVFFHRVLEICERGEFDEGIILGHLMAHELGHLLLGQNSHSAGGIMTERFLPDDLRRAQRGFLLFDVQQAALIRGRLAKQLAANR